MGVGELQDCGSFHMMDLIEFLFIIYYYYFLDVPAMYIFCLCFYCCSVLFHYFIILELELLNRFFEMYTY